MFHEAKLVSSLTSSSSGSSASRLAAGNWSSLGLLLLLLLDVVLPDSETIHNSITINITHNDELINEYSQCWLDNTSVS